MFLIVINIVKLIQATREYSKQISNLMLKDLNYPNSNFPCDMIIGFREHAKQENIEKEFDNDKLICYLALKNNNVIGFIVGYKEDSKW